MRIADLYTVGERPVFSLEFFTPMPTTVFAFSRSLLTRGEKSLSPETMAKTSTHSGGTSTPSSGKAGFDPHRSARRLFWAPQFQRQWLG